MLKAAVDAGVVDDLVFGDPTAPRFVYWEGRLRPTPSGLDALTFDLMTLWGKIRAGLGAVGVKAPMPDYEESVEQFIRRNLGDEVFYRLIEPFCRRAPLGRRRVGVYAGNPSKLSMKAAFGKIWDLEKKGGSFIGGTLKLLQARGAAGAAACASERRENPPPPRDPSLPPKPKGQTVGSFRRGLTMLPQAIADRLGPGAVKTSWELKEIFKEGGIYRLVYDAPEGRREVRARVVALTVPAYVAADLVRREAPDAAAALKSLDYPPGVTTLGTIYSSSLFPGRAPPGQVLLLNYIGGALNRGILDMSEDAIVEQARPVDKDLRKMLLKPDAPPPKKVAVRVWPKAIPQFNVGHLDVVQGAQQDLAAAGWDGVLLGGNYTAGVALGKCVEHGFEYAQQIADTLAKQPAAAAAATFAVEVAARLPCAGGPQSPAAATTGQAFALALGLYSALFVGLMLVFSVLRKLPTTKKLYAPKRYSASAGNKRLQHGRNRLLDWVYPTLSVPTAEVVTQEGTDAACYLMMLRFGMELFAGVSLIVLLIALPINLTAGEVDAIIAAQAAPAPASNFTFWLGTPTPVIQVDTRALKLDSGPPQVVKAPELYEKGLHPAPPGLEWWEYREDVPLLPQPAEVLGPAFVRYRWRYDGKSQVVSYTFSSLDKTTMANIAPGSPRLYAHAVITWLVSLHVLRLLWRYNKRALHLRIQHLLSAPPGAQSHTVLLSDIPGVEYGTLLHRCDNTLLRFLPKSVKRRLAGAALSSMHGLHSGLGSTVGWAQRAMSKMHLAAAQQAVDREGAADGAIAASRPPGAAAAPARASVEVPQELQEPWSEMEARLAAGASVQAAVDQWATELFGDEFDQALLVHDTSALDPLINEYRQVLESAANLVDVLTVRRNRRRPPRPCRITVVPLSLGRWGLERYGSKPVRVDALPYYRERLLALRRQVGAAQAAARRTATPSAFVTFKSRRAQVVAAHSLLCRDMAAWRCQPAPGPAEVVWGNVGWRAWERRGRELCAWAAFGALALFFMVPVSAAQSLLALNAVVSFLGRSPALAALLTAVLPGLALRVFLALLPAALRALARASGATSLSAVDLGVVERYFLFQVLTVFFGSFVAGSMANQIKQARGTRSRARGGGCIMSVLGTAAPSTAIFFTTFLMLQALLVKPLALLRPLGLALFLTRTLLCATERAKARLWQGQTFDYGTKIPDSTIAILLGLVFCVICPIIAPLALLCLAFELLLMKYQLLWVFSAEYESGGKAWPIAFNQVMCAVVLFQLTMAALLGLKRGVAALLVAPLPLLSLLFWVACRAMFRRPQLTLALADAARLDAADARQAGDGGGSRAGAAGTELQEGKAGASLGAPAGAVSMAVFAGVDATHITGAGTAGDEPAQPRRGRASLEERRAETRALYQSPSFRIDDRELADALAELDEMHAYLRASGCASSAEGGKDVEAQHSLATVPTQLFATAQEEVAASPYSLSRPGGSPADSPAPSHTSQAAGVRDQPGRSMLDRVVILRNPLGAVRPFVSSSGTTSQQEGGGDGTSAAHEAALHGEPC
eukprot:scaffold14.g1230.t1